MAIQIQLDGQLDDALADVLTNVIKDLISIETNLHDLLASIALQIETQRELYNAVRTLHQRAENMWGKD